MLLSLDIALPAGERQLYENDSLVILFSSVYVSSFPAAKSVWLTSCCVQASSCQQCSLWKRRVPEDEELQLQRYHNLTRWQVQHIEGIESTPAHFTSYCTSQQHNLHHIQFTLHLLAASHTFHLDPRSKMTWKWTNTSKYHTFFSHTDFKEKKSCGNN